MIIHIHIAVMSAGEILQRILDELESRYTRNVKCIVIGETSIAAFHRCCSRDQQMVPSIFQIWVAGLHFPGGKYLTFPGTIIQVIIGRNFRLIRF